MALEEPYLRIEWKMEFMDGFWPDGGALEPDSVLRRAHNRD
jgi:hypothetical protein